MQITKIIYLKVQHYYTYKTNYFCLIVNFCLIIKFSMKADPGLTETRKCYCRHGTGQKLKWETYLISFLPIERISVTDTR